MICEFYIRHNEFEDVMFKIEELSEEQVKAILHMAIIYLKYDEYCEISKTIILRYKNSEMDVEYSLSSMFCDNLVDVEHDSELLRNDYEIKSK